jgi:hypothetical protein
MSSQPKDLGQILEQARGQMGKANGLISNALDFIFNETSNVILQQQEEIKRLNELLAKKNVQEPKK